MVLGILIGVVIWLLFDLNKAYTKPEFSYTLFFKLNLVPVITNIICGLAIVWFKDDIADYFVLTKFSSVMIGFGAQALFKRLIGVFDKKVNTVIGVNKDKL